MSMDGFRAYAIGNGLLLTVALGLAIAHHWWG